MLEQLEDRLTPSAFATPGFVVGQTSAGAIANGNSPQTSGGYTPAQIQPAYGLNQITFGSVQGNGAGETIAIVDAYSQPTLAADVQAFDTAFNLPTVNLTMPSRLPYLKGTTQSLSWVSIRTAAMIRPSSTRWYSVPLVCRATRNAGKYGITL
jgi:hypothetical protein